MHDFHDGRRHGLTEHLQGGYAGKRDRRFRVKSQAERDLRGWGGMSPRRSEEPIEPDPRDSARGSRRGDGPRGRRGDHLRHEHLRGPRGRAQRGDVRAAVLRLLTEHSMHGYQMMHAIAERTGGTWRVSPGAIYPTIAQLEDEGLVRIESEHGRKLVVLTDAGRSYIEDAATAPIDPFAAMTEERGTGLRDVFEGLAVASKTLGRTGSPTQIAAAREVLEKARRELYLILADDPGDESAR
jgi:DNA-binding PadR family transcriptional regulator